MEKEILTKNSSNLEYLNGEENIDDMLLRLKKNESENAKLSSLMADIDNEFLELDELLNQI
jgi:hypothetical protein